MTTHIDLVYTEGEGVTDPNPDIPITIDGDQVTEVTIDGDPVTGLTIDGGVVF